MNIKIYFHTCKMCQRINALGKITDSKYCIGEYCPKEPTCLGTVQLLSVFSCVKVSLFIQRELGLWQKEK